MILTVKRTKRSAFINWSRRCRSGPESVEVEANIRRGPQSIGQARRSGSESGGGVYFTSC